MNDYKLVKVATIRKGSETVGNIVELTGNTVRLQLDFIGYIENIGDGEDFPFYRLVTMKDGTEFKVSHDSIF